MKAAVYYETGSLDVFHRTHTATGDLTPSPAKFTQFQAIPVSRV